MESATASQHPVRLAVTDDLRRNRLTVFFRAILAIPHYIWLWLWTIVALYVAVPVNWLATLIMGRSPQALHEFLAAYTRYRTHFTAYMTLLADPYPGFTGAPGYPVDVEIAPPGEQNRLVTLFRLLLVIPALVVSYVLLMLQYLLAFFGWFVCLVTGEMPEGMRNLGTYVLRFEAQTGAYLELLTDRYPSFS
jgi:hypothetical protein